MATYDNLRGVLSAARKKEMYRNVTSSEDAVHSIGLDTVLQIVSGFDPLRSSAVKTITG